MNRDRDKESKMKLILVRILPPFIWFISFIFGGALAYRAQAGTFDDAASAGVTLIAKGAETGNINMVLLGGWLLSNVLLLVVVVYYARLFERLSTRPCVYNYQWEKERKRMAREALGK